MRVGTIGSVIALDSACRCQAGIGAIAKPTGETGGASLGTSRGGTVKSGGVATGGTLVLAVTSGGATLTGTVVGKAVVPLAQVLQSL